MLLDQILFYAPCPIFWKDLNGKFLGCNRLFLKIFGAFDYEEIIGKMDSELPWHEYSQQYSEDDKYVITTGETMTKIENIPVANRIIISETTKTPLIQDNEIIGVLGICLDITDRIEAEKLKIENAQQKLTIELEEHKKFRKVVNQMAHDLGSPLMVISVIAGNDQSLPEKSRLLLQESVSKVRDITGSLLNQYKSKDIYSSKESIFSQLLVFSALEQLIMDKQYEYQNLPVKFSLECSNKNSLFAFIQVNVSNFKRMLSNLVNNAVDALDAKKGNIIIKLDSNKNDLIISIIDNGNGMPQQIIDKIMSKIEITSNKKHGHGLGFSQVHDTLNESNASININSELNIGTTIVITFPKIAAPEWATDTINLYGIDTIVVLDDDCTIHGAWDIRFKEIMKDMPDLSIKYFEMAIDIIDFINSLPEIDKDKILLLTDYELLKQKLNGLNVIEQTNIKNSVLVTSHYNNQEIQKHAVVQKTKILPKQLATEIMISR